MLAENSKCEYTLYCQKNGDHYCRWQTQSHAYNDNRKGSEVSRKRASPIVMTTTNIMEQGLLMTAIRNQNCHIVIHTELRTPIWMSRVRLWQALFLRLQTNVMCSSSSFRCKTVAEITMVAGWERIRVMAHSLFTDFIYSGNEWSHYTSDPFCDENNYSTRTSKLANVPTDNLAHHLMTWSRSLYVAIETSPELKT